MKFLLILSLSLTSVAALANKNWEGKTLDEKKQMMSTKIDQKIEVLQASKSCITSAKDDKALKKCKEDKKEAMEDIKDLHKDHKKQKEEIEEQVDEMKE